MSGYKKINYKVIHNDFLFLKKQGLKPYHKILDVGCGGGRLGFNLIQYLNKKCYYGFDKEEHMITYFKKNINNELVKKEPQIELCDFKFKFDNIKFDYIYAYSVLSHNTKEQFSDFLIYLKPYIHKNTKIFFSILIGQKYFQGNVHKDRNDEYTGVWYTIKDIEHLANKVGYNGIFIGDNNKNWENVERKLNDTSISVSFKKYGNGVFSPFETDKCKKKKCNAWPHTHGTHQEMFLFQLN